MLSIAANLKYNGNGDADDVINVAAGVDVLALNAASDASGLSKLAIDLTAPNLTGLEYIGIGPTVGFRVVGVGAGNLSASLSSRIYLPMGDGTDKYDLDFDIYGNVSVPLTSVINARLGFSYYNASALPTGLNYKDGDGGRGISEKNTGDPVVIVKPSLAFTIAPSATITTGYSIWALLASETKLAHAISIDFAVSF